MVVGEFQAVIFAAGRGSRMTDLTSGTPKCLLPVGNQPVLCHTISILEQSGFQDVLIVVLEDESNEIQQSLIENSVKINFDLVTIPSDEDWGTADSLRHLISQDKIKKDIILLTCDLFTNSSINKLLNVYRKHKASFVALFFQPLQSEPFQVPGLKSKFKPEKDIIGIDIDTSRLMFLASASDFEETVPISWKILKDHPKLSLRTDLIDGHFYILSHRLAEYLATETFFVTLKGEFFPHVVKKQHVRQNLGNEESSVVNETSKKSLFDFMKASKLEENISDLSTYNDHEGDLKKAYHGDVLKCYAVIADQEYYGIRINSLQSLCFANRMCTREELSSKCNVFGARIHSSAAVESNQVDSMSFIGSGCKIKEKTSIKTSVIGDGCIVNTKTRISHCIILKNVEIEEGCVMENCVIARNAKIGPGCELKNCFVGPSFSVPKNKKANSQVLTKSEGLMEI